MPSEYIQFLTQLQINRRNVVPLLYTSQKGSTYSMRTRQARQSSTKNLISVGFPLARSPEAGVAVIGGRMALGLGRRLILLRNPSVFQRV